MPLCAAAGGRYSQRMHTFGRELRQAWRSLVHRKVYFIACSGTLALVLGANAAMFAVVNATMLRPLPFSAEGEVVHLFAQPPGTSAVLDRNPLQQMEVPRLRERARTLARLEGFYLFERVVWRGGEPQVAKGATVTPGLLEIMAAPLSHGRLFAEAEGEPGHAVALVTHRYWRDTLGSADVLGTPLVIDDQPHTIVGVLGPEFAAPFLDADVFAPLIASPEPVRAPPRTVVAIAELAPGATLAQAQDELRTISDQLARELPRTHAHWVIGAEPFREWQYGSMRAPLLLLLAATALVLMIACVNIANLTSAHAIARSGELSLRLALGASRSDVIRFHIAELLVVAVAGLIPGLLLARGAVPALLAINPGVARTVGEVSIDWRVQLFSVVVALVAAVAASMVPALRATRGDAASAATVSTRTTSPAHVIRFQRALVSVEVALCVALLMAGGVVIKGLHDLSLRGPGYASAGVLTAQIRLPEAAYRLPQSRSDVVDRMLNELRPLPGVQSVAITQNAFLPRFSYQTLIRVKDRPAPDDQPLTVQYRRVSADYFQTMQIKTIAGRTFSDGDTPDRPPVAIISKRFADTLMPGLDPIGRQLVRNNPPLVTIVGVVDDVSDVTAVEQGEATLYVPWSQNNNFGVPIAFVIRTAVEPSSLIPQVREALKRVDATLPLRKAQPLEVFIAESTAPERFRMMVLSLVATLGLLLAAVGIAGVTYRSVVDRTMDFAVRLALGSAPAGVVRLVMLESIRDLTIGIAAGVAAGAAACVMLARSLDNIAQPDAVTTGIAVSIILAAGLGAAMLPALQIMRVQPAGVLRR
jgi:putative ABC transport system permease protein